MSNRVEVLHNFRNALTHAKVLLPVVSFTGVVLKITIPTFMKDDIFDRQARKALREDVGIGSIHTR